MEKSIQIIDNDVYDGEENTIFEVCLSLLYTEFERVNISTECVEVQITEDDPIPEGVCVFVCVQLESLRERERERERERFSIHCRDNVPSW